MVKVPVKLVKNIKKLVNLFGYTIVETSLIDPIMNNDERFIRIYDKCRKFTMTSKERMYALYKSVEYIIKNDIPGDFVECGVWRGGSTMLIAHILIRLNVTNRKIYLYDTFTGMSQPTDCDYGTSSKKNGAVLSEWKKEQREYYNKGCYASLSEVKKNMGLTKYPKNNIVFIKGKVEETIPEIIPFKIALLRLDTDWYESTKHELIHLFPQLLENGVLIIDDYGAWAGAKKAVDEYFSNKGILLNRIDKDSRIGIKMCTDISQSRSNMSNAENKSTAQNNTNSTKKADLHIKSTAQNENN